MGVCFLTLPPTPPSLKYSQLCSIFGFGGVSPLKPQVSSTLQHPCREMGSKGAVWCWTPAAAKDGPKLRALIMPPRRSMGAVILGPFHQSRDKQGQGKIIQIKTGNLNVFSPSEGTQIIIQDQFRPVDCDFNCSRSFVSEFSP